jgi:hypothetical protein
MGLLSPSMRIKRELHVWETDRGAWGALWRTPRWLHARKTGGAPSRTGAVGIRHAWRGFALRSTAAAKPRPDRFDAALAGATTASAVLEIALARRALAAAVVAEVRLSTASRARLPRRLSRTHRTAAVAAAAAAAAAAAPRRGCSRRCSCRWPPLRVPRAQRSSAVWSMRRGPANDRGCRGEGKRSRGPMGAVAARTGQRAVSTVHRGTLKLNLCEAYWTLGPPLLEYPTPGLEKCWSNTNGILPQLHGHVRCIPPSLPRMHDRHQSATGLLAVGPPARGRCWLLAAGEI